MPDADLVALTYEFLDLLLSYGSLSALHYVPRFLRFAIGHVLSSTHVYSVRASCTHGPIDVQGHTHIHTRTHTHTYIYIYIYIDSIHIAVTMDRTLCCDLRPS